MLLGLSTGASYTVLAGFIFVVGTLTAILLPDPPLPHEAVLEFHARRELIRPRVSSLLDPSFTRLLVSRIVNVGNAFGIVAALFFLLYGIMIPAADAENSLLILIVIYTVFVVTASILVVHGHGQTRKPTTLDSRVGARPGLLRSHHLHQPELHHNSGGGVMGAGYGAYSRQPRTRHRPAARPGRSRP